MSDRANNAARRQFGHIGRIMETELGQVLQDEQATVNAENKSEGKSVSTSSKQT
jgi:hypothetical protein